MASSTSEHCNPLLPVEFIKGVNGLDRVILRETHGSSTESLEDALIKCVMITPEEVIERTLDSVNALARGNALAKIIYSCLFDCCNSFERFYINFTNKKLQQHFNQAAGLPPQKKPKLGDKSCVKELEGAAVAEAKTEEKLAAEKKEELREQPVYWTNKRWKTK